MATWPEQILSAILCPGTVDNVTQLNNFITLQKLNRLLVLDPTALDADTPENSVLNAFKNAVECGNLFEEFVLKQYEALIEYKIASIVIPEPEETCPTIIAAGIGVIDNPETSVELAIPGVQVGDVAQITIVEDVGAGAITGVFIGANSLEVQLESNPAESPTSFYYVITRPCEEEEED